jgi:hypothetical protein
MAMTTQSKPERWQDWINLVLAVCLFISPWVLGFADERIATWDVWACAVVVAVFSIAALVNFAEWEEWVSLVVGVWLAVSPWVLQFAAASPAIWAALVIGILVALVAAWEIWSTRHPSWRATA